MLKDKSPGEISTLVGVLLYGFEIFDLMHSNPALYL